MKNLGTNKKPIMKKLLTFITLSITSVSLQTSTLRAQDGPPPGGNFDPEQMRQHMLEHLRQQFDVKDDSEWSLISNRVAKVMEARRAAGGFGFGGPVGFAPRFAGPPPGPDGGPDLPPPGPQDDNEQPGSGEPRRFHFGPGGPERQPNPKLEALRQAIASKASADELKNKLADLRASRQKKQAELDQAQDELRQLLTVRQEAVAVTFGLLK